MRIGIVTIFHVPNYGAMLQCYALASYLRSMGHDVFLYEIPFSRSNRILSLIKRVILLRPMNHFVKNFLPKYTENLKEKADIYMVGSDQVWNPDILHENVWKYMLSFVPSDGKRVSYAASFGTPKWNAIEMQCHAKELLSKFDYITVREASGVEILKNQFDLHAYHVLDPCFLLDDYLSITGKTNSHIKKNREKTLVTYKLIYSHQWHLKARDIAKDMGCKFNELNGRYVRNGGDMHGFNVKSVSVAKWINSIANADYVITDSFHGTVFALMHHRRFAVLPAIQSRSTRLTSLLSMLGLTDRIAATIEECKDILEREIDYTKVSGIIEQLRLESREHIRKMLEV